MGRLQAATCVEDEDERNIGRTRRRSSAMDAEKKKQALQMASQEMEYRVDLFNRMVVTCFDKCADRKFKEGDLSVGENSCVDRCTAKYWQVTSIVGQMLGGAGQGQ